MLETYGAITVCFVHGQGTALTAWQQQLVLALFNLAAIA